MVKEKLKAGLILRNTGTDNLPQEGLLEEIIRSIHEDKLDIFLGPEWLFIPKDGLYTQEEKEIITSRLADTSKERNTLIIPGSIMWFDEKHFYNTSPIISEGQVLGEYNKHLDCGSSLRAHKRGYGHLGYRYGTKFGRYNWRGYNLGVEICADRGELARFLKTRPDESLLDLYFLVSCGPYLSKDIPVKNLGYGLCSNGTNLKTEVRKREDINEKCSLKVIHSKNNVIHYTPRIDIYELEMDKCA